jgi:hypothetical protein
MSAGFVHELCRGLAISSSLVSLEISNCALPPASYRYLSSALRTHRGPLQNLTVDVGAADLTDLRELFRALQHVKSLTTVRIVPALLPNDEVAATALVRAVAENPTIERVKVSFPNALKAFNRRLLALLHANRALKRYRPAWEKPDQLAPSLWPGLLSRIGRAAEERGSHPVASAADSRVDRAAMMHVLYHHVLRGTLPPLVATRETAPQTTSAP